MQEGYSVDVQIESGLSRVDSWYQQVLVDLRGDVDG